MAIKITVDDMVGFKVKGTINDAAGVAQPFDFGLTCKRLSADQITAKLRGDSDASITDFMVDVVTGWSGVKGDDDKPVSYTPEQLRALFQIPGVGGVAFRTYLLEVGAKEKN